MEDEEYPHEWRMNNILILSIHPPFIPIHPPTDEWVKSDPHSSPFPIHLLCPELTSLYRDYRAWQINRINRINSTNRINTDQLIYAN